MAISIFHVITIEKFMNTEIISKAAKARKAEEAFKFCRAIRSNMLMRVGVMLDHTHKVPGDTEYPDMFDVNVITDSIAFFDGGFLNKITKLTDFDPNDLTPWQFEKLDFGHHDRNDPMQDIGPLEPIIMLIPLYLYPFIRNGSKLMTKSGSVLTFKFQVSSNSHNNGLLNYGVAIK